jgi:hypothetical protein
MRSNTMDGAEMNFLTSRLVRLRVQYHWQPDIFPNTVCGHCRDSNRTTMVVTFDCPFMSVFASVVGSEQDNTCWIFPANN